MATLRVLAIVVLLFLLVYTGSYVWLSAGGKYQPSAIGLSGVKWYEWAPKGFVRENLQHDSRFHMVYHPLWRIDRSLWHPPVSDASETRFPINEIPDDEVGKLYVAWGLTQ